MEGYLPFLAEVFQVGCVCLVIHIFHSDVYGMELKAWFQYQASSAEHLGQAEGVFSARDGYENLVIIVYQLEFAHGFRHAFHDMFSYEFLFCQQGLYSFLFHEYKIYGADNQQESQQVVPV